MTVVTEFHRVWHGDVTPTIEKVVEILLPRDVQSRFEHYRLVLVHSGGFGLIGSRIFRQSLLSTTNVQEVTTYHSSQCICDFGVKDMSLCDWPSCGICNIIKSSFRTFAFGVQHNTGSYGAGIYSYHNPAKAHTFATSSTSSPYRVLLSCSVLAPGPPHDVMYSSGGDVVLADCDGKAFAKSADAIMPSYAILYTR